MKRVYNLNIEDLLEILNDTINTNQMRIFKNNDKKIINMIENGISIEIISKEFDLEIDFIISELERRNINFKKTNKEKESSIGK